MGRYTGPSCRQCRREGTKLFLKGTKCFTEKCPVERRPYAPGQHGQARRAAARRRSTRKQLREKQKIKRIYGVSEKQFRNTFERVTHAAGHHGPQPARRAREPPRQHRVPHGLRRQPQGRAPAHPSPSRRGERQVGRHPELPRAAGRGSARPHEVARAGVGAWRRWISRRAARRSRGSRSTGRRSAAGCSSARAPEHSDRRAGTAGRRAVLEVTRVERRR